MIPENRSGAEPGRLGPMYPTPKDEYWSALLSRMDATRRKARAQEQIAGSESIETAPAPASEQVDAILANTVEQLRSLPPLTDAQIQEMRSYDSYVVRGSQVDASGRKQPVDIVGYFLHDFGMELSLLPGSLPDTYVYQFSVYRNGAWKPLARIAVQDQANLSAVRDRANLLLQSERTNAVNAVRKKNFNAFSAITWPTRIGAFYINNPDLRRNPSNDPSILADITLGRDEVSQTRAQSTYDLQGKVVVEAVSPLNKYERIVAVDTACLPFQSKDGKKGRVSFEYMPRNASKPLDGGSYSIFVDVEHGGYRPDNLALARFIGEIHVPLIGRLFARDLANTAIKEIKQLLESENDWTTDAALSKASQVVESLTN